MLGHSRRRDPADLGQDRSRRRRAARRGRPADPGPEGRSGRPAPGAHLRLVLRPVPGRRERGAGRGRDAALGRPAALLAGRGDPRRRGDRRPHAGAGRGRRARPGRGRLPRRRDQERRRGTRRRDGHRGLPAGDDAARGLPEPEADGVLRPLPDRRRRVPGPARRAREAQAERLERDLRARDERGARLRVPLRLPRSAAHGDRPRAPRARVRPLADRHGPVGRVRRAPHQRRHRCSSTTRRRCPSRRTSTTSTSRC